VFVALIIQHVVRMRRIVLSSVACPAQPYFSTLYHNGSDFRGGGGVIEHKVCILIFFTTSVGNISHSKKNSARYYHKCTYVVM
jgi:hypothetical protein